MQRAEDQEAAALLLTRLDRGLPIEALPLSALGFPLARGAILALFNAGHFKGEAVAALTADVIVAIIGRRGRELHEAMQLVILETI